MTQPRTDRSIANSPPVQGQCFCSASFLGDRPMKIFLNKSLLLDTTYGALAKINIDYLLVVCFLALLLLAAPQVQANLVTNSGFETSETTYGGGYPKVFGEWEGDVSQIVSAQDSITPMEGIRMLQFKASGYYSGGYSSSSQIYQLIDVSHMEASIDAGLVTATASAFYNRVPGDTETDTRFTTSVRAHSGTPGVFNPSQPGLAASWSLILFSDSDLNTWEEAVANLLLPAGTDYLSIELRADEDAFNDPSGTEYDGHYVDNVSVTLTAVPLPAAVWLFGSALGILGWMRRISA